MLTETDKSIDEAQIRRLLDDWAKAVYDRNLDNVMSFYAPDIVAFDVIPPLQFNGIEAYRKNWQMGFDCMQQPMQFESRDLGLSIGDDVAFSHRLVHMSGTMNDGQAFDNYVRWTSCFRKINGRWLITHEHISVPIDMNSGKGLMDLKP